MVRRRILVVALAGSALAWAGCEEQQRTEGTGGSGPEHTIQSAQERSEEALERAKQAQSQASSEQQQVSDAQRELQAKQQALQQAEQKLQKETQEAKQAQTRAEGETRSAQQTAQSAQQEAQQAQQQQSQQAQQEQTRPLAAQTTQPEQVEGIVISVDEESLELQEQEGGTRTLSVGPEVTVDGQRGATDLLAHGTKVRVTLSTDGQEKVTRIETERAMGGAGQEGTPQPQPEPEPRPEPPYRP